MHKPLFIFLFFSIQLTELYAQEVPSFFIDQLHSSVNFKMEYLEVMEFDGSANDFYSKIYFNPEDIGNSSIEFIIYTRGLTTGMENRDNDLYSDKYLDVEKYPAITFISDKLFYKEGSLFAEGGLTIKDIVRTISIPATILKTDEYGGRLMYVIQAGPFSIKRSDFNIGSIEKTSLDRIFLGDLITVDIKALYKENKSSTINGIRINNPGDFTGRYKQSEKSIWRVEQLNGELFMILRRAGIMWKLTPIGRSDEFFVEYINKKVKFFRKNNRIEGFALQKEKKDFSDARIIPRLHASGE